MGEDSQSSYEKETDSVFFADSFSVCIVFFRGVQCGVETVRRKDKILRHKTENLCEKQLEKDWREMVLL